MENAQIWISIEALCNEAESVIKNREPAMAVIHSIPPPALAYQVTPHTNAKTILSCEPAPSRAKIRNIPTSQDSVEEDPLSLATMAEIAAAIDRASQSAQKPQVMEQPSQGISDRLRKDLMIEISLAVRSVLENELPKMVRQTISESLYELINSSIYPVSNDFGAIETKTKRKVNDKKTASKKRAVSNKNTAKKTPNKIGES